MKKLLIFWLLAASALPAQTPQMLPGLRERAEMQQQWLKIRLEKILPALMRKHGVSMWLVISREYNEDPLFFSLVSPAVFAARRRTIYVFYDRGPEQGVERLALGGGSNGGLYEVYRDPESERRELVGDAQWATLRKVVEQRNPANIAVNISSTHAFSDGLSAGEHEALQNALGAHWMSRVVRAEKLPIEFLETRIPEMLPLYRQMMEIAHWLISRAFSAEVIVPAKTTDQDLVWWLRQQLSRLGLETWFQPNIRVQRRGKTFAGILASDGPVVIERGDVLHVDFGISALRLHTDTQHMGYVLQEGETDVPAGVQKALENANRLQDIVLSEIRPGRTGNEVLARARSRMAEEGIQGAIYCHPVGDHGHGAGPLIGLWDRQEGVPGRGDLEIIENSWFSIELSATTPVPEWDNQELWVAQEEDAFVDAQGRINWILRRQTRYHLVKP